MRILIIGKNSYIGDHIDEWLTKYGHEVELLDVLAEDWKTYDYSPYDAIVHVAGIVHRPNCQDWNLYKSVNTDMPIAIASSYKSLRCLKGLKGLYVYFSTMGVYDAGKKLAPSVVDEQTPILVEGNSMYGKSKAMAEEGLLALMEPEGLKGLKGLKGSNGSDGNPSNSSNPSNQSDNSSNSSNPSNQSDNSSNSSNQENNSSSQTSETPAFNVAFVRPPSVYGKRCKGGYITGFTKIARLLPIIPRAYEDACQSFIYIDNLCECVRLIIERGLKGLNGSKGSDDNSSNSSNFSNQDNNPSNSSSVWTWPKDNVFCPQDDETPNANRLLEVICKGIGKKYRCSRLLGLCLQLVSFVPLVKKAYGGIEYSRKLSDIPGMDYVVVSFEEGMKRTVS